jgi:hypothetical protein
VKGSAKETDFIFYVDQQITNISRKHALRFDEWAQKHEPDAGYASFVQAAADLDGLIDMVWISGTRKSHTEEAEQRLKRSSFTSDSISSQHCIACCQYAAIIPCCPKSYL